MLAIAGSLAMGILPFTQTAMAASQLTYQTAGAPIQSAPVVYLVFWGEQWSAGWTDVAVDTTNGLNVPTVNTYTSNQSKSYITDFFAYNGGGGGSYFSSTTQYCSGVAVGTVNCGGSGTHVGNLSFNAATNVWVDTTSTPPPTVVPDNCAAIVCFVPGSTLDVGNLLAQEAIRAQSHFLGTGNNPSANFIIMLPKATATVGYGLYCAYHSEAVDGSGRRLSFTNMPYVMDMNVNSPIETAGCGENFVNPANNAYGNGYMDGYSMVAGHEEAETMTDPLPFSKAAWRDSSGAENGDKCAWITPGTAGGAHNVGPDANGHVFAVQTEWSNSASGCV